jgi:hypothetical protein
MRSRAGALPSRLSYQVMGRDHVLLIVSFMGQPRTHEPDQEGAISSRCMKVRTES